MDKNGIIGYTSPEEILPPPDGLTAVLIATSSNGVVFGYINESDVQTPSLQEHSTIVVRRARSAYDWPIEKDVMDAMEKGPPIKGTKVGERRDLVLRDVRMISTVTDKARIAWESAGWDKSSEK